MLVHLPQDLIELRPQLRLFDRGDYRADQRQMFFQPLVNSAL
jgi:hypothetical protein